MVIEVTVKVPEVSDKEMGSVHDAARDLSDMTASGTVNFSESKTFQPVDDHGKGGKNWKNLVITAECETNKYDEDTIRSVHRHLVQTVAVPSAVAIETKVPSQGIHLVG
jgi:hypothetical protein